MVDRVLSPKEFTELQSSVKLNIEIDGYDVYVTDIAVCENNKLKVAFFCKTDPEKEEELAPHVYQCIMNLIEEQKCKSKEPSFHSWYSIKNILLGLFHTLSLNIFKKNPNK